MTEYKLGDQVLHRNEEFRTASGGPTMTVVRVETLNQRLTLRDTDGVKHFQRASDVVKLPDLAKGDRVRVFGDTEHGKCGIFEPMPFDTEVVRAPLHSPGDFEVLRPGFEPEYGWLIHPEMMTRLGPVENPPAATNLNGVLAPGMVYCEVGSQLDYLLVAEMADGQWLTLRRQESGGYEPVVRAFEDDGEEFLLAPGDPEGFQRALVNLAVVFNGQATTIRARDAELAEVERWKEELTEEAHRIADDKGWCSDFDDFMEEHGLERRQRGYTVTMEARYRFPVNVYAESEEEAEEEARNLVTEDPHDYIYPSEYDHVDAISTEVQ